MIQAQVLADSLNHANDCRVTTFLVTYPRFILAELNTHRVLSRNTASSRAIPVSKTLREVWKNPAAPVRFGRSRRGMQDAGPMTGLRLGLCRGLWFGARYPAMAAAWLMVKAGLHKQVANRLLEPWVWTTTVVTATEWENFYRLRLHKDAQPEFRELAERMLDAHRKSKPVRLLPGKWHLPFASPVELSDITHGRVSVWDELKRCTARCARTSYVNFYGKDDPEDDRRLHDRLAESGHWSPFEHCCQAATEPCFYGNLRGYLPYRKLFPNETHDHRDPPDLERLWKELTLAA
jgi:hypothetical protein